VGQRDEAEAALLRVGCGAPEQDERPNRLTLPAPRESLVLIEEAAAELRRAGSASATWACAARRSTTSFSS
jgi:hypothetical protein